MRNKYRIVRDGFGYEAQIKYWWFPFFWLEIGISNYHSSIDDAKKFIQMHKNKVVWTDDPVDEANRILKANER